MFGGADGTGHPNDNAVYAMRFVNRTTVQWTACSASGLVPSARMFTATESHQTDSQSPVRMLMFGGLLDQSAQSQFSLPIGTATNELWALTLPVGAWPVTGAPSVTWSQIQMPSGASAPVATYLASAAFTTNSNEFWVLGGLTQQGTASTPTSAVWSITDDGTSGTPAWAPRTPLTASIWAAPAHFEDSDLFVRTPEVYDPVTAQYTTLLSDAPGSNAPLLFLQDWYPHMFVLPWGVDASGEWTVFAAGPDDQNINGTINNSYVLKLQNGSNPRAHLERLCAGTMPFRGGTTVMYRPGKFIKLGGRDTDSKTGIPPATSMTIDLSTSLTTPAWVAAASMPDARVDHNATILPDGTVFVSGGLSAYNNDDNSTAHRRPMIWDPDGVPGSTIGTWRYSDLSESEDWRGYHHSVVLLPDARLLCTGGNSTTDYSRNGGTPFFNHQLYANVYSPPYLFAGNGDPAPRPDIAVWPNDVDYGAPFQVTMSGAATAVPATRFALIAAGSATHAFDESQRYIPLNIVSSSSVSGNSNTTFTLTMPSPNDATLAPQGYYMLFAVSASGVPSIAPWVHVGWHLHPSRIVDLSAPTVASPNHSDAFYSAVLTWTPPLADTCQRSLLAQQLTAATYYKLVCSSQPPSSYSDIWAWFANATQAGTILDLQTPHPAAAGTQSAVAYNIHGSMLAATGLPMPVVPYYAAILATSNLDGISGRNWSAMSNIVAFNVTYDGSGGTSGGGGGGFFEEASARHGGAGAAYLRRPGGETDSTLYSENSLLVGVPANVRTTDRVLMPFGPVWTDSAARLRLSHVGVGSTRVDSLVLIEVDHAPGEDAFVKGSGFAAGTLWDSLTITRPDGTVVSAQVTAPEHLILATGDTLSVSLPASTQTIAIQASDPQTSTPMGGPGLVIQARVGGEWTTVGLMQVRQKSSVSLYDVPPSGELRIISPGVHSLERVANFVPGTGCTVLRHRASSYLLSGSGDVTAQVLASGANVPDGVRLYGNFADAHPGAPDSQDWFLELTGASTLVDSSLAGAARATQDGEASQCSFRLEQNTPNPYSGLSTIRFSLPSATTVRLDLFDLQGRRVSSLTRGRMSAGWHVVDLGRTAESGSRLAAGVYLCRLAAGGLHADKKIVLLP